MDGSGSVIDTLSAFLSRERLKKVVVACSAGPDSVALAVSTAELHRSRKARVILAHVNHQLRGRESTADENFVRSLGRKLGVPVRLFRRPVKALQGNLEENARDQRYEALLGLGRRWGADAVLTAHTVDDQAETVMMNALRGCGTEGLGGMSSLRVDTETRLGIGRPFLTCSHDDLVAFLRDRGQAFRLDASNADPKFFRNYIRLKLFKDLEKRSPGFRWRLGRLADVVRDEQPQWEAWIEKAAAGVGRTHKGGWLMDHRKFRPLSVGLQRRLLRRWAGRDLLTFDGVERLRNWMETPPTGGRFWQLRKDWVVERLSKSNGAPSSSLFWFHRTKMIRKRTS